MGHAWPATPTTPPLELEDEEDDADENVDSDDDDHSPEDDDDDDDPVTLELLELSRPEDGALEEPVALAADVLPDERGPEDEPVLDGPPDVVLVVPALEDPPLATTPPVRQAPSSQR